ncbi:hypothetical protein [Chamaesiphon sp. OTE_75_metabat_556]|uniref:hypothetical protein n=1 Tax=Chamaesiphon sp. OTE_75_metabat_556 TaxID=2964692 RepID=UPI00286B0BA0|nr:hypothetical protein [Chamaesiphon sp. OTE_75_metabat_556]
MLEISPKIVRDVGLSVTDVTNYLIQHGWQKITSQNDRLQVFQGINDDLGNPIILPLPINDNFIDTPLRLSEAVNLVAFVENRAPESVLIDLRDRCDRSIETTIST